MTCRACERQDPNDYHLCTLVELTDNIEREGDFPHQLVLDEVDGSAICSVLLHLDCYDSGLSEVIDGRRDTPPIPGSEDDVFECTCCGSGVRLFESYVHVEYGTLRRGLQRGAVQYVSLSTLEGRLCLSCANLLGGQLRVPDLVAVTENGECESCRADRCWRQRHPPCVCDCHNY